MADDFAKVAIIQIQIQILYLPLLGHRPIQAYTYTYKYQTKMQIQ